MQNIKIKTLNYLSFTFDFELSQVASYLLAEIDFQLRRFVLVPAENCRLEQLVLLLLLPLDDACSQLLLPQADLASDRAQPEMPKHKDSRISTLKID